MRSAKLNARLFAGPEARSESTLAKLALNLFPDVQPTGIIVRTESFGNGRWVGYGYVEGEPNSQFTLAAEGEAIAATVFIPRRGSYRILYQGNQWHTIAEIDPSRLGACGVDGLRANQILGKLEPSALFARKSDLPATIAPASPPTTNSVTILDLMVVYTPEARAGAGDSAAMHTLIDLAVAEANTVYQNSEANVRLRLVHRGAVDYKESPSLSTNLNRLQIQGDGFMDEVHSLRETNRADVVCLLTEHADEGVSGLAFTMGEPSIFFRPLAFSVVKRADAVGTFIFVHEISHNLGCQHDREHANDADGNLKPGAFPYSYGHRFVAGGVTYRTVMAYAPGQAIPYLSNPNILFMGVPTGLPGTTNGANNVLTISNTAPLVGAFYGPLLRTAPPLVSLSMPTAGTILMAGTNLTLKAQVYDRDGLIKQVEFYQENELVGVTTNILPGLTIGVATNGLATGVTNFYSVVWTNDVPGEYRIIARAVDTLGASSASLPIQVIFRPRNDDYANRVLLAGSSPTILGSNRAATVEPSEAMHAGNPGGKSVWYYWVAPQSGTVSVMAQGAGMLPLAEVYKPLSATSLTSVSRDFDFDSTNDIARVAFDALAGETYAIAIDSIVGTSGEFTLSLAFQLPPENDQFTKRMRLSGDAISLSASNSAATLELGEPLHAPPNRGGKSVWFTWNAPKSGAVVVQAATTNFFPLLDVYRGKAISALTNVPGRSIAFDSTNKTTTLTFEAVAAQDYELAVDGLAGGAGLFTWTLMFAPPPPNDDFSNRVPLLGTSVALQTSNRYATKEAGEPLHFSQPGGRSIWYSWKAPVSGPVVVVSRGDNFFTLLDVYTGNAVVALTNVPGRSVAFNQTNFTSTLTFNAVAYRTYTLAVDGFSGFTGAISLSFNALNSPPSFQSLASLNPNRLNFRLSLYGSAGQRFVIQASTNLAEWGDIFSGAFITNSFGFADDNSHRFNYRFYRVLALP